MTRSMMNFLGTAASLTWIAQEVSRFDPRDALDGQCIFCHNPVSSGASAEAHREKCCWRVSKEFIDREDRHEI